MILVSNDSPHRGAQAEEKRELLEKATRAGAGTGTGRALDTGGVASLPDAIDSGSKAR